MGQAGKGKAFSRLAQALLGKVVKQQIQKREPAEFARQHVAELCDTLGGLPFGELARALDVLKRAQERGSQVFIAGNGGSAAIASHMANDLMKTVARRGGRGLRAIALVDSIPLITAIANDENYREVFAGQLEVLGQPDDVVVLFSGSGNSPNILRAAESAKAMGISSIAFLGMGGGRVRDLVDVSAVVPSDDYGVIEDTFAVFDDLITAYLSS